LSPGQFRQSVLILDLSGMTEIVVKVEIPSDNADLKAWLYGMQGAEVRGGM
jgi:hypothetical protein